LARTAPREAKFDLAAHGYPAIRQAFNEVLNTCAKKLTNAEIEWASEVLGVSDGIEAEEVALLMDAALFSPGRNQTFRPNGTRPIDRIAKGKLFKGEPLKAYLLQALPHALFSIFEFESQHPDGGALLKDLLNDRTTIYVMDHGLAQSASARTLLAGRFVDLGPWHIGFGVVSTLRRSEAAALMLSTGAQDGGVTAATRSLHEPIYTARLHGQDLIMLAIEPLVMALSLVIDTDDSPLSDIVGKMRSALARADA